nr:MAG TPA: hypothetical protein [Bacteriophage sp.]
MSKMNDDILMRQLENTFSYFAEQVMRKGHWNNHPADIAALTAVDVLVNYCTSLGRHCQECIFNNKDDMCDLFSRIRQEIGKEML